MADFRSLVIGWREWLRLPDLGIRHVKAKIDTGARSSSLHAFDIKPFDQDGKVRVRFSVHPLQRSSRQTIKCEADVLEFRSVRSSTGHAQKRPVIVTTVEALGQIWPIEVTLANRDAMGFRMLLGREAVRGRFLVDAGKSFYSGTPARKKRRRRNTDKKEHSSEKGVT
ncbi:MAG: ATP-dependent zinc protease [Fuerstiella sp.]